VNITVLTLFPGIFRGYLESSILARAIGRGLVSVAAVDIRDFATDRHHVCDDAAYGGGPGMVMKPEPIAAALEATGAPGARVIYLTPSGRRFTQAVAEELSACAGFTLLCGRYEGIDQRVIDAFVTDELSIGDYVLSGGEVGAMAVVDAVVRLVPGVITGESLEEESFSSGLLEYPHYTRPEEFRGMKVPEVLLSGHHEKIRQWRLLRSVEKTLKHRPDLLESDRLPREVRDLAVQLRREGDSHGRDEGA